MVVLVRFRNLFFCEILICAVTVVEVVSSVGTSLVSIFSTDGSDRRTDVVGVEAVAQQRHLWILIDVSWIVWIVSHSLATEPHVSNTLKVPI